MPTAQRYVRLGRIRTAVSQARALRPVEWFFVIKMLFMLAALLILQNLLSLPKLVQVFDAPNTPGSRPRLDPTRLNRLTHGVLRRFFEHSYCMKRSLILFHFLRKWGYPVRIHFGITKSNGKLDGHAWLDLEGRPFAERKDPRLLFKSIYSYPQA